MLLPKGGHVEDLTLAWSDRLSTLVHAAKAVERNEIPFSRDNRVIKINTTLDRDSRYTTKRGI